MDEILYHFHILHGNGQLKGRLFNAYRGLRQSFLLSLLLFIVIMKALNKMLIRARELVLFRGLMVGVGEHAEEITHLLFIDDTMLFCEPDEHAILNLIWVLMDFLLVFGIQYLSYQV